MSRRVHGHALKLEREDHYNEHLSRRDGFDWTASCKCGWKGDEEFTSKKWARHYYRQHKAAILSARASSDGAR